MPSYTLYVLLTDLNDSEKIIYRSTEAILIPEKEREYGIKEWKPGVWGWVPNVVFTCGVVPRYKDSNEILDEDDEIFVYYGVADEVMAAAKAKISELIPAEFLKVEEGNKGIHKEWYLQTNQALASSSPIETYPIMPDEWAIDSYFIVKTKAIFLYL